MNEDLCKEIKNLFPSLKRKLGKELETFKNANRDEFYKYHSGIGLWLRSNKICPNREFMEMFRANGIQHPDDMAERILEMFHEHLNYS
ncbi:MAG: hypothetical protein FWH08_02460 [Oscillospiraceae bacterium]|nr:hypothetical protein [Oscillospiraceae bacterium]